MLYLRILTALFLIPLVIWGVIKLPIHYFELIFGAVAVLGALEWANLCRFSTFISKSIFVICVIAGIYLSYYFNPIPLLWVSALFWIYAFFAVFIYSGKNKVFLLQNKYLKALVGILCLVSAWYGLMVIRRLEYGPLWVNILFALIWSSDSFAYFIGRKWGKTPLAPFVSPKKTWQGFWSGLLGPLSLAISGLCLYQLPFFSSSKPAFFSITAIPVWISLVFVTLLLGILGDLFESLVKRISKVKDSGALLPGHGGVLDRIDSLLATLPFFALSLTWILGH